MVLLLLSSLSSGQGVPDSEPALQGADGKFSGNEDLLQLRIQGVPLLGLGTTRVGGLGAVVSRGRAAAQEGGHGPGQEVACNSRSLQ